MNKNLLKTRVLVLALGAAVVGCGGHAAPAPAGHHTAAPAATSSSLSASQVASNEREFADALAQAVPDVPAQIIAGPVMADYAVIEHAYYSALAAAGDSKPGSVSQVPGGYSLCYGTACTKLNAFTTNAAGQITGVSVNGSPVAGRLAAGPDSAMGRGLQITGVFAYRSDVVQSQVIVVFAYADHGYAESASSPAVLPALVVAGSQLSYEPAYSVLLPRSLARGNTGYGVAMFDTTSLSGTFELISNGGNEVLVSSPLAAVTS